MNSKGFLWLVISLSVATFVFTAACSPAYPPPPQTERDEVVDTLHGVSIADPYRWLEDQETPETRAWIDSQNDYAERVIGESPLRAKLRERFARLMRFTDFGSPTKGGDYEYFTMRRANQDLPVICRRPAPPEGEMKRFDTQTDYEVLIDPHEMSQDHTTRVDILSVSPDGKLLIYSVRDGGQDEVEVRIRDIEQGVDLPERLPNALYSSLSFEQNGSGFYYSRRSRQDGARIYYHEMGSDMSDDEEIFGEGYGPKAFIDASELADGRYLLFNVRHGWSRSEMHFKDLKRGGPVRAIVDDAEARFFPRFKNGLLYVRTNLDAPNNRLITIDLENPSPDRWKEIVAEGEDVMQDFAFIDDKLYVNYLHNVSARIAVYEMDGTPAGEVPIPDHHRAAIRGATEGKALLTVSSFTQPPATYLLDLETGEMEIWEERQIDFNPDGIAVQQIWYESKDGTKIPMYVVHRQDIEMNGDNPTLLYGYGGFISAQMPRFDVMGAAWVEQGGVFAMANLRGGSEFGERWHRAGMLGNKQNVFDDFIAAAEWLIANQYTRREKLAIRGASNGGLLVGSALTQRPELYRAVLCGFPDLDMVRFYSFTETNNLPALHEYGDASIPEQFEFLRKYSPYQAVTGGVAYPAVMLTSGDLDTRVSPLQARKMTARLQAATSSGLPVILRYHPKAGHAASRGLPLSRNIEDRATELAFLLSQLGVEVEE
jgi:prolyl oligopeptidase